MACRKRGRLGLDHVYYGASIQGLRRATHGYPLYPKIFNMVVGVIIRTWVMPVAWEESGLDGFGRSVQWLAEFSMRMTALGFTAIGPPPGGTGRADEYL